LKQIVASGKADNASAFVEMAAPAEGSADEACRVVRCSHEAAANDQDFQGESMSVRS
jgi:hypothetical protein